MLDKISEIFDTELQGLNSKMAAALKNGEYKKYEKLSAQYSEALRLQYYVLSAVIDRP